MLQSEPSNGDVTLTNELGGSISLSGLRRRIADSILTVIFNTSTWFNYKVSNDSSLILGSDFISFLTKSI